jgi:hypothetical protein
MPTPTPPTFNSIKRGAKSLVYTLPGHNEWEPICCQFHAGQVMVSGNDDAGNPPVYSDNVGFQTNCDACRVTALNTLEYMQARYSDVLRSGG